MSDELKPCPFCGKEVEVYKMIRLLGHEHPGFIRCDCVEGVSVPTWNTRPLEDALRSRVEELMDSNHKWQEKCGDLEQDNEKLRSLMEELEMMIRARDATIKEMRIERGRLNHAVDEELARLREQVRWIPVEERLPEVCTNVLVGGEYFVSEMNLLPDKSGWVNEFGTPYHKDSVTHWMPLPIPPEVK